MKSSKYVELLDDEYEKASDELHRVTRHFQTNGFMFVKGVLGTLTDREKAIYLFGRKMALKDATRIVQSEEANQMVMKRLVNAG